MLRRCFGTAINRFSWDSETVSADFARSKGRLIDYQKGVLTLVERSPDLTMAVLLSLAGSLLEYYRLRTSDRLISETALFNFAGPSSVGKSTCQTVALSVFGPPDAAVGFDASVRGLAKHDHARNCLVAVVDDAENADDGDAKTLYQTMRKAGSF